LTREAGRPALIPETKSNAGGWTKEAAGAWRKTGLRDEIEAADTSSNDGATGQMRAVN
jgi:hypothetical protein